MTVGEWIAEWLPNYAKLRIRERTYEKYLSCFSNYILPKFKTTRLRDLSTPALQKHFNELLVDGGTEKTGLSTSTIGAARRYFALCIDDAIKEGILLQDPVRLAKAPRLQRKEIVVITKNEVARLIEAAKEMNHPFMYVMMPELISLAVRTGLRQGEIFGLMWEDVDFSNSCIFVRRSLAHVVGKGAVFQETKTKGSRRRILLLREDVDALQVYRAWQKITQKSWETNSHGAI